MPKMMEITLRDMATGQLGTIIVSADFWLTSRITQSFWKKALPELHARIELIRETNFDSPPVKMVTDSLPDQQPPTLQ